MTTNPREVPGAWRRGWTLDVHTTASEYLGDDEHGHPRFETARSPIGELLYQLKYRGQRKAAGEIADVMAEFFEDFPKTLARIDLVVPVPPSSTARAVQPVGVIAAELGKRLEKTVATDAVRKTRETPRMKDVKDPEERRELLDGAFQVDRARVKGKGS